MADELATSYLAPYFGDYVSDFLGRAQGLGELPYQPYTGDRFAGPSTLQQQAFSGIGGLTMPGQFQQATNAYSDLVGRIGGYNPQQIGPLLDASDTATVNRFMSPYQQDVTNIALRQAQQRFDEGQAARNAAAVKARAFGGGRQGVTEGIATREQQNLMNDIGYRGLQDAFGAAQTNLNNQRQAELQAAIANQNAGLNAFQTGVSGLSQAGAGLASLGTQQGTAERNIFQDQLNAGATQQALNQQPYDFGYQQWQESLKYPYQMIDWQKGLLQGLPLDVKPPAQTNPMLEGLMAVGGLYDLLFKDKG